MAGYIKKRPSLQKTQLEIRKHMNEGLPFSKLFSEPKNYINQSGQIYMKDLLQLTLNLTSTELKHITSD